MRRPLPAVLLGILAACLPAAGGSAEPPPELFEAAEAAAALCRELGGTPAIRPGYQTALDLNGDGREDYLTDQAHLACDGAWSAFCRTAGCPVTAWLSRLDGGHEAFDLGHLQAVRVILEPGALPAVRATYHGAACGDGQAAGEGCTRTWVFATNAPATPDPDPPETAAAAAPPSPAPEHDETVAEPVAVAPEPVPPGWTLREVPGGSPAALGGGTGSIASLAAFCLGGQPFLAVTWLEDPAGAAVRLGFDFAAGQVDAEAGREETAGGAYVVPLAGSPLAARLAGRDSEVTVRVGDRAEGALSLAGSTRAIRGALAECHRF